MVALRKLILNTPFEPLARRLYIRLDRSPWSEYDRLTLAIMRRCLRANSNCVDIGAHRGTILAEIMRQAPEGIHYAFEPVPEHCHYLERTFPKVRVHQLALSNVREQTLFLHDRQHPTRSCFWRSVGVTGLEEVITVQTDLLDNVIPDGWPIAFLKVDVEGAELAVLQGAVRILRAQRPVVVFEHTRLAQICYGVTPGAMYELLTQTCGMQISLLRDWLGEMTPLDRAAFEGEVNDARSLYFVAHP